MADEFSPVVLFVYNRPEHTCRTLQALASNDLSGQSSLYIYADGPKLGAFDDDLRAIAEVRSVIREKQWCGKVNIIESFHNKGLADSIIGGVTDIVNRHGRVIVLEDDIVTKLGFLRYMNDALELYKHQDKVMHVSGMIFGTPRAIPDGTSFLRILSCHGWGTWKRAWRQYIHDPQELITRLNNCAIEPAKFDIEGSAHFYSQLQKNRDGAMYTWAVRWYASWLTAGGYSLFPHRSLLENIGHDGSGVHAAAEFYNGETVDYLEVKEQPVQENNQLRREVDQIWRNGRKLGQQSPKEHILVKRSKTHFATLLRKTVRKAIGYAYPELRDIDEATACRAGLQSTAFNSEISPRVQLYKPYHINSSTVGDYTYIMPNNWISMARIGKFCSIGSGLTCGAGIHPIEGISTAPMFYSSKKQNGVTLSPHDKAVERKPVTIGNDVFIGMNVTILDGVTIGDGAVIGAGCVVSKDVPPYTIVVGNPMRIVRHRFPEKIREKLQAIKWWDWPEDQLHVIEKYFFDVEEFVKWYAENAPD